MRRLWRSAGGSTSPGYEPRGEAADPAVDVDAVGEERQAHQARERWGIAQQLLVVERHRVEAVGIDRPLLRIEEEVEAAEGAVHRPGHALLCQHLVERRAERGRRGACLLAGLASADDLQRGDAGGGRERIGIVGAGMRNLLALLALGRVEVEIVQDVAPANDRAAGQSARQDLGERREVGRDAELPCAPPGETRNPSPPRRRSGNCQVWPSRSRWRNDGGSGAAPKLVPVGSRITQAMSLRLAKVRFTASTSPGGSRITCSATPASTPAVGVPSKWLAWPEVMWSCQPWKCVRKRTTLGLPVTERESRTAISVASVPDEVKRTLSADGTSLRTSSAQRTSRGWFAPKCVPWSSAAWLAATTLGWLWPRRSAPCPPK